MDQKFNILHVVSKLRVGGVENMLFRVVTAYDKKRFNPVICCISEGGEVADKLKRSGYKVEILNRMRGHGFDLGAVKGIYDFIKRENIHILRTHQYHSNLYGRLAGRIAGVPVIIPSFHNLYRSPDRPKFQRRLFNYILSCFTDKLVAVSNAVASDMVRYDWVNPSKTAIIYNGIEIENFNIELSKEEARKIFNMPVNAIIIGSVGRLTEQKGHNYLLKALANVDNCQVVITGDGPLRKELEALAERLKVKCILIGELDYIKIPAFLKALDIFSFPSLWEGLPSALIEAMAAGIPVIATDIPPHKEVLGDTGIFVPPGDADELTKAVKMLIDDPSLMRSVAQKENERVKMFSVDNTVKTYEKLFEEILKKKKLL
jgi:glycosyltransferase involved in cell wall biosynthesis